MGLSGIIAELKATLESEAASRKCHRYAKEEQVVSRVRADLATGNREDWLEDTLTVEQELG